MVYNYRIKVTLKGFEKLIKRTFVINDNVKINDFCKVVITSMNIYIHSNIKISIIFVII